MSEAFQLTRRDFLKVGSTAGGGLLVAVFFSRPGALEASGLLLQDQRPQALPLSAFVEIGTDGSVTIIAPCPEIGQGVRTSLPMIVAEELGIDWSTATYKQASADPRYGAMGVGGSDSVTDYWEPLRTAGAAARELLKEAAAQKWGVSRDACEVEKGIVIHPATNRRAPFAELVEVAAGLPAPDPLSLKDPSDFELVGTRVGGVDVPAIVTGRAEYGLDLRVPGMLYAVVERSPVHGGRAVEFDASDALRVPGVREVVEVEPLVIANQLYGAVRSGVAVIADSTWAAMEGRAALRVTWDEGRHAEESTENLRQRFRQRSEREAATTLRDEGNARSSIETASVRLEADYELPILAHVCMEPVNFTAEVGDEHCEVWGPIQNPRFLRAVLAFGLPLPRESVGVHPTLSGGGFGRRLAFDYGIEAAMISKRVGAPVKVVWTREDDVRHDYYRTPSYHRLRAGLDEAGRVLAWQHHILTASLARNSEIPREDEEPGHPGLYDVQGAADIPYAIDNILVEYSPVEVGLQMGSWRSVAHSFNIFVVNSFLDEIAAASGADPLELQLRLLGEPRIAEITLPLPGRRGRPRPDTGLLRRVLQTAAEGAGWGDPLPAGWGRGIACCYYKKTYAAHVAEVSADAGGRVTVRRVVAALDCGRVVNPSGIEAQAEGAVMDAVATVLKWEITVDEGRVEQSNFHD